MLIICNRNDLLKGVSSVYKAVSTKSTLPLLGCILLKAEGNHLTLLGNDLELAIQTNIEAVIRKEGEIAVNARMFSEIIRRLPDEDVKLETDDNYNMTIECARSKFNLMGQSGEDFPLLPEVETKQQIVIPQATFKNMIRNTIFSIAPEDSGRPILTGELLDIRDGYLYMVAVDGFRISLCRTQVNCNEEFKVTVPGKALTEIHKILENEEDSLMTLCFTGRHVLFQMNETIVLTRLLEGEFLAYQRNLNMEFQSKITVFKQELLDSVDRAALISRESKNSPIRLQIEKEKMIITSNAENGSAYEEVALTLEGEELSIAFNPRYYLEALKAIEEEEICIKFCTSLTPCIIQGTKSEDAQYFILPIRLHS